MEPTIAVIVEEENEKSQDILVEYKTHVTIQTKLSKAGCSEISRNGAANAGPPKGQQNHVRLLCTRGTENQLYTIRIKWYVDILF